MTKSDNLKKKYLKALKKKKKTDKQFQKALNNYFCHIYGKNTGPAIAYASTLDW